MFKSFKIKIFLVLFFVSFITLTSGLFIRHYLIKEINKYIEGIKEDGVYLLIREIEREYARNNGFENINLQWLGEFEEKLNLRIIIEDQTGKKIYYDKNLKENELTIEYPLFWNREYIGNIKIIHQKEERIKVLIDRSKKIVILTVYITLSIILILSVFISNMIAKPLKKITEGANEIAKGNLNVNIDIKSNDEIGTLSEAFSLMLSKLKLLEDLRRRNVANLSHEMRTPLTILKGNLIALNDGVLKKDENIIKSLIEEIEKLEKIADSLKTIADIDSYLIKLKKEEINLKELTKSVIDSLKPLFNEKRLKVIYNLEDLIIKADKQLYIQVLTNLLTNGIKASDYDGIIEIRLSNKNKELRVKDYGIGIDEKDLPYIFERFYRKFRDGMGIGLSLVRDIANAHNWHIDVYSDKNKGTEFVIKFKNS